MTEIQLSPRDTQSEFPNSGNFVIDTLNYTAFPRHVYVVLPCFNEAKNIPSLVKSIANEFKGVANYDIIAVNDGSSDNTLELLDELSAVFPIKIIQHPKNMGLSITLNDGLMYATALSHSNDVIVTMDADNTHNANYILSMLKEIDNGAEIVIASRYVNGGCQKGVPNNCILLSKGVNYFLNCISGISTRDATSGYRCYKASVLKKGKEHYNSNLILSKGFEIQVELLVKLSALSERISEIPFELRYDKKKGKSKMPLLETVRNYIILSVKIISWKRHSKLSI